MTERRRKKRFTLRLPLELIRSGSTPVQQTGQTKNVGPTGVLFLAETVVLQIGDAIEYRITLPGPVDDVILHCWGRVLRKQDRPCCTYAATLERYDFVRHEATFV